MTDISTAQLRQAFGAFPSGVTVVTTTSPSGSPIGFTASSFTSVSMEPPLLLVCIDHRSENLPLFRECGSFGVNILAAGQEDISSCFASPQDDRFAHINWYMTDHNTPMISDTLSRFDCSLETFHTAGDHDILIGRIIGLDTHDGPALGYFRGRYVTFEQA